MKTSIISSFLFSTALLIANTASATGTIQGPAFKKLLCKKYASKAVEQNNIALQKQCGYTGPRWSSNYNGHYNWCMHGNNLKFTKQGTIDRDNDLKKCKRPIVGVIANPAATAPSIIPGALIANKKQLCSDYANTAIKQNKRAIKNRCGFNGPRWSSNFNGHYKWCMRGNNLKFTKQATADRKNDIKTCKQFIVGNVLPMPMPNMTKLALCDGYAKTAVKQSKQAAKLKCGFWGTKWNSSHKVHYDWCLAGNNSIKSRQHTQDRNRDLKQCGKDAKKEDKEKLITAIGGFLIGAIIGNQLGGDSSQPQNNQNTGGDHTNWCYNRYRSYRASDNTFQPYNGPRRQCISPYY